MTMVAGPVSYRWIVLQDGSLPLGPQGGISSAAHVCTVTLLWPDGQPANRSNSLIIDPSFNKSGWSTAVERMAAVGMASADIGFYYECHQHYDHRLQIPPGGLDLTWQHLKLAGDELERQASPFPGMTFPLCSGHTPDLTCVRFRDQQGEVWVASDAILDRQWLSSWQYYWPNRYSAPQIVETWRSVAKILAEADTIIPGHGAPIRVDAQLLQQLVADFPYAEHASQCPDVLDILQRRLDAIEHGGA